MRRIYLDTAARTALDPRVKRIMALATRLEYGNPSSLHQEGVRARQRLEEARREVARNLGAQTNEIIFTSGGTEGNNLAINGVVGNIKTSLEIDHLHLVTTVIEHPSVLEPIRQLERQGCQVTYLPVSSTGQLDPDVLAQALTISTVLVSIGYVNNEIGTVNPLPVLAKVIRRHRVRHKTTWPYFHTDACQASRFYSLNVDQLHVDLLTLNAGKMYGPAGSGALYIRRGVKINGEQLGGGQERGWRSGTENVAGAVGLAAALTITEREKIKESQRLAKLRDYLAAKISQKISGVIINGSTTARAPNNLNLSFVGANGEYVVLGLDAAGVAISSGSACSTRSTDPSYVLAALGRTESEILGSVRFTLGRDTSKDQLDYVIKILPAIVARARIN